MTILVDPALHTRLERAAVASERSLGAEVVSLCRFPAFADAQVPAVRDER